jgi:hypothetical protein
MAGSPGNKAVAQKLGIKPGFCIFVDGAPSAYEALIGPLPANVTIKANQTLHSTWCICSRRAERGLPQSCGVTARRCAGRHDLGVWPKNLQGAPAI